MASENMKWDNYPIVYEINTWAWLDDISRDAERQITLGNVPDGELKRLAGFGFDAIWLMGVWERSKGSRNVAREHTELKKEYNRVLPGYTVMDVIGSPYAIKTYTVDPILGGNEELIKLRHRLRDYGLLLILDFVPNHFARDHDWLISHPKRLICGDFEKLSHEPDNYYVADNGQVFAHGRDPYFSGWTDTVQLDYRKQDTRQAMSEELILVAELCDGVRCDMAMMIIHEVFLQTWGGSFEPSEVEFWPMAIEKVKSHHPDFLMMAEVYWGMEAKLQQQGFDYTYDKHFYDLLVHDDAGRIRSHLHADMNYQRHLVRFTENHDERRAMDIFDDSQRNQATSTLALSLPGMRLVHEGQIEGYRFKLPVQLRRRPREPANKCIEEFYQRLLLSLHEPVFHLGEWQLLEPQPAWDGSSSHLSILGYQWSINNEYRLIAVNLSINQAQCFLPLHMPVLEGSTWCLQDILNDVQYQRDGNELSSRGLYLDMMAYGHHIFRLERKKTLAE